MRNDQRFEIERAFDLLPHVVGASWAAIWFRMKKIKSPTRQEYREKSLEFFRSIESIPDYPDTPEFVDIIRYIKSRREIEYSRIINGENKEIEKRYDRYIDYG